MSLITLFGVSFLTFVILFLTIGSYRTHQKKLEKKKHPKLIIANGFRTRER